MMMGACEMDINYLGIKVQNTRRTRTGGVLLVVDSADTANRLADRVKAAVGGMAKGYRTERYTTVLLLDVFQWVDKEVVQSGLICAGNTVGNLVVRKNRQFPS